DIDDNDNHGRPTVLEVAVNVDEIAYFELDQDWIIGSKLNSKTVYDDDGTVDGLDLAVKADCGRVGGVEHVGDKRSNQHTSRIEMAFGVKKVADVNDLQEWVVRG